MNPDIFVKMKAKPQMTMKVYNPPASYPKPAEYDWDSKEPYDFIQVFAESQLQFRSRFRKAARRIKDDGLLCVSYPKSTPTDYYDINRDILWDILLTTGFHPVAQIALDDHWTAMRVEKNILGQIYDRPNRKK